MCQRCKTEKKIVWMYNHKAGEMGRCCQGCVSRKFQAIMIKAEIDFNKIQEEVDKSL